LRTCFELREGPARQGRHGPFEEIERAIENGIVAAVLDDAAGMRNRGAITLE